MIIMWAGKHIGSWNGQKKATAEFVHRRTRPRGLSRGKAWKGGGGVGGSGSGYNRAWILIIHKKDDMVFCVGNTWDTINIFNCMFVFCVCKAKIKLV